MELQLAIAGRGAATAQRGFVGGQNKVFIGQQLAAAAQLGGVDGKARTGKQRSAVIQCIQCQCLTQAADPLTAVEQPVGRQGDALVRLPVAPVSQGTSLQVQCVLADQRTTVVDVCRRQRYRLRRHLAIIAQGIGDLQ